MTHATVNDQSNTKFTPADLFVIGMFDGAGGLEKDSEHINNYSYRCGYAKGWLERFRETKNLFPTTI